MALLARQQLIQRLLNVVLALFESSSNNLVGVLIRAILSGEKRSQVLPDRFGYSISAIVDIGFIMVVCWHTQPAFGSGATTSSVVRERRAPGPRLRGHPTPHADPLPKPVLCVHRLNLMLLI